MKVKKMTARLYQFNNIEEISSGRYLYPLEKGGMEYVEPMKSRFQHLTIRFPDALKMLFGR